MQVTGSCHTFLNLQMEKINQPYWFHWEILRNIIVSEYSGKEMWYGNAAAAAVVAAHGTKFLNSNEQDCIV